MSKKSLLIWRCFCVVSVLWAQNPRGFEKSACIPDYTRGAQKVLLPVSGPTGDQAFWVDWSPEWFMESSFLYNHGLARALAVLSETSYWEHCVEPALTALSIPAENITMCYDRDYANADFGYDQCAVTFAHFSCKDGTVVIFVLIRGTPTGKEEWISNANIANSISKESSAPHSEPGLEHEGFGKAAALVEQELDAYLAQHEFDQKEVRFILTGHSRGAAVANIMAAHFVSQRKIPPEHIFAYTFACPNVTRATDVYESTYDFIWNIVNQEDIIATVPSSQEGWGYRKYGRVLGLVNAFTAPSYEQFRDVYLPAMNAHFSRVLGRDYRPFKSGNLFPYLFSKTIHSVSKDVNQFYNDTISLHRLFVKNLEDTEGLSQQKESWFQTHVKRIIEKDRPHFFADFGQAINDMHICVSYFSWLLALDTPQAFETNDSYIVEFLGCADVLIADSSDANTVYAHIGNGSPESAYKTKGVPAMQFPSGTVVMALPGNRPIHIEVSADSLFNTRAQLSVLSYTGAGYLREQRTVLDIPVRRTSVYTLDAGAGELLQKDAHHIKGKAARTIASQNTLHTFAVKPELFFTSALEAGIGLQCGLPKVYGVLEASTNRPFTYNAYSVSLGGGLQTGLAGPFSVGMRAQWKAQFHSHADDGDRQETWAHVPSAALTLSYQPKRRFQIMADFGADVFIHGFNDAAFSHDMRPYSTVIESLGNERFGLYPYLSIHLWF